MYICNRWKYYVYALKLLNKQLDKTTDYTRMKYKYFILYKICNTKTKQNKNKQKEEQRNNPNQTPPSPPPPSQKEQQNKQTTTRKKKKKKKKKDIKNGTVYLQCILIHNYIQIVPEKKCTHDFRAYRLQSCCRVD